jgi:hypothetical protein
MQGVQAVVAQLAKIDNRTLCVWNGHTIRFISVQHERLGPLVYIGPYAIRLHKLPPWDTGYIPNDVAMIVKAHGGPCLAFSGWKPNNRLTGIFSPLNTYRGKLFLLILSSPDYS